MELLTTENAGWETARRINNERLWRRPALITRCASTDDVRAALALARERELEISVRGGGHSVAGWSSNDRGLVIDLTPLNWVRVDPATSTAWVGGGTRAGDLIAEAAPLGLVPVTGVSPAVGLSGLVLGLGEGYLTPRYGFGCDSVLAAELVTANGEVLQVSAETHPELFWALRGAGANFGVVTALRLRLHPAPDGVVGGWMRFAPEDTLPVTQHAWEALETGSEGFFPFVVYELDGDGQLVVRVLPAHTGPGGVAEREVDGFRRCGRPIEDRTRALSYAELLDEFEAAGEEPRKRMAWDLCRFPFHAPRQPQVEALLAQAKQLTPFAHFTLWRTVAPPPPSPAAAPRHSGISLFAGSFWSRPEDDDAELGWLRSTGAELQASGTVREAANAVNHVSFLDGQRLRRVYGDADYDRLAQLKAQADPENLFRSNANIVPA